MPLPVDRPGACAQRFLEGRTVLCNLFLWRHIYFVLTIILLPMSPGIASALLVSRTNGQPS